MKTLIVHFLPRGERSHTKKLLDAFLESFDGEYEEVDLTKEVPDFFNRENLAAYIKRNYLGEGLNAEERLRMSWMDHIAAQFKAADRVVLAFPMHNFSEPAVVKAYFDSVMLKQVTWDSIDGSYQGLMAGKKACVFVASGGKYQGERKAFEHAASLAEAQLRFMGFAEVEVVTAAGMNLDPEGAKEAVEEGRKRARQIAQKWSGWIDATVTDAGLLEAV